MAAPSFRRWCCRSSSPSSPPQLDAHAAARRLTVVRPPRIAGTARRRRPASATPLLDKIGRDLTALARQGMLTPIFGREQETQWVIETLLRTEKRNPVLLGPAGVGKTAIVEGLAQRIVAGSVPQLLKDVRLVEVPLGGLVAGTQYRGQLEDRVLQLVNEASRARHRAVLRRDPPSRGTGQSEGGIGAAELLKPALARGDIAVIGATTADAWRDTIAKDDALARRFSTLRSRSSTRPPRGRSFARSPTGSRRRAACT